MFWPVVIFDDVFWMSFGSWKAPCSLDLSCPAGRVNPRLSRKPIANHSNDGHGQNLSNAPIGGVFLGEKSKTVSSVYFLNANRIHHGSAGVSD